MVSDEIDEDAYNIEAKYLVRVLNFAEDKVDASLETFLANSGKKEFHDLANLTIIFLNKLSRSSRISDKFFQEINEDLIELAVKIEEKRSGLPKNDLLKILNKINRRTAISSLFTKPSSKMGGYIKEGPSKDDK